MLRVYIAYNNVQSQFVHAQGPLEFGRGPERDVPRRVLTDPYVSADHLRIDELAGARLRLQNLSKKAGIRLTTGSLLEVGAECEVALPVRLTLGETLIQFEAVQSGSSDQPLLLTVDRPYRPGEDTRALTRLVGEVKPIEPETLAHWLEAVIAVQRASASSNEFYGQTARAVVDLIGLDTGLVLLRRGNDWEIVAQHVAGSRRETVFSHGVLERVCQERRTFYQGLTAGAPTVSSLQGISAVVAAPILADDDQVVGVVYGSRLQHTSATAAAIRPLEAQLVQVLAAAVGAGLARLTSEANAARRCVQFEQFFSTELARELDRDPSLLEGRSREITVLFIDVRGYSRISERLTPRDTCLLTGDIMDRLTERVREHGGVVINYVGDALHAMWNAPADQPDHATLACRAALAMHTELPGLDARWKDRIGRPIGLGIGINTGRVLVGNTGSRSKFMYGPLGHAVNLASRVEGATKLLGVPILITGSTHEQLDGAFATRRLCRVRVVGIDGAVDLYELHAAEQDGAWQERREAYEAGLVLYESAQWAKACRILYPLLTGQEDRYDLPTLSLIGRCIEYLKAPQRPFDPVMELDHK